MSYGLGLSLGCTSRLRIDWKGLMAVGNRDEGSYQLSHIYDNLFAATSSGGDWELVRSFRRRQQLLPKRQQ